MVSVEILAVYVSGSDRIHVEAVLSREGMSFWDLEKRAPIFCFRPLGAKGPSRALNREVGRGGAAVGLVDWIGSSNGARDTP